MRSTLIVCAHSAIKSINSYFHAQFQRTRRRSDEDERELIVTITDSGEALKEKAVTIPERLSACVDLNPQKAQALYELLYEVLGTLTNRMTPIGYPAQKMSVKESLMRKGVRADSRVPFTSLFYDSGFDKSLAPEQAGVLAQPLELVRWAPSAVNKQPWRAVAGENAVHFYLKHTRGFVSDTVGDMQKIDMGIALCHFALAAEENGLNIQFCINDPGIPTEPDTEYIVTYLFQ